MYHDLDEITHRLSLCGQGTEFRLIAGLPFWVRPSPPREQQKKHLVLSDPTLAYRTISQKRALAQHVAQLIADGFSVSLATMDGLHPLNAPASQLFDDFTKYPSPIMHLPDIYEKTIQANKTLIRDNLLVLDDHGVEQLLNPDVDDLPRSISMRDIYAAFSKNIDDLEKYLLVLQDASPPLTQLWLDLITILTDYEAPSWSNSPEAYSYSVMIKIEFKELC